jgi:LysM repeat protein
MKILKILGIAAAVHALALLLIFANPGCSYSKAAPDTPPISAAPQADAPSSTQSAPAQSQEVVGIRYSPTRPGTTVASALETEPVSDVTPATTYTVSSGDTLSGIAKRNKLTKAELASANNLRPSSTLHVGQKLVIPSKSATHPAAEAAGPAAEKAQAPLTEATKHVVKPGETLGGIARKYGVKQGDIAVANNITDPRRIQPGQELVIPAHASKASKAAKPAEDSAKAPPQPAGQDQDLDAGLKPPSSDVPVVKIDDASSGAQPKSP